VDALVAALPGLQEHGCSYREPGGFIRRMREDEGTWLGHVLEHVAIELQNVAGEDVSFGKTRSVDGRPGVYTVVYEYAQRDQGIEAGELAIKLLCSLLPGAAAPPTACPRTGPGPRRATTTSATRSAARWGPATASLVKAAVERNIPWLRLNEQSLIQLGQGKYQQRIQATVTGRTSYIAVELAQDKEETNKILANCGLPVPRQELVRSAERAVRAAERLGLPGGDQALQRQPWPRHRSLKTPRKCAPVSTWRPNIQQLGDRRDLPAGRRPPPAGDQRRAGRRHAAHAGACGGRRR
jgi:cyanophycin synthetase